MLCSAGTDCEHCSYFDLIRRHQRVISRSYRFSISVAEHRSLITTGERTLTMTKEEDVLAALDKPGALYSLQQRLDPSSKSTEALQDLLMRMRAAGKVKSDIKTGKWIKA